MTWNRAEVTFFNLKTGEEVKNLGELNLSNIKYEGYDLNQINTTQEFSCTLENVKLSSRLMNRMFGRKIFPENRTEKKLLFIKSRTKSKRIAKKVSKRLASTDWMI